MHLRHEAIQGGKRGCHSPLRHAPCCFSVSGCSCDGREGTYGVSLAGEGCAATCAALTALVFLWVRQKLISAVFFPRYGGGITLSWLFSLSSPPYFLSLYVLTRSSRSLRCHRLVVSSLSAWSACHQHWRALVCELLRKREAREAQ